MEHLCMVLMYIKVFTLLLWLLMDLLLQGKTSETRSGLSNRASSWERRREMD